MAQHDIRELLRAGAAAPQSAPDISRLRTRARRHRAAVSVTALATVLVLVGGAGVILTRPSEVLLDGSHGAAPDARPTDGPAGVDGGPTEAAPRTEASEGAPFVSPPASVAPQAPTTTASPSPSPSPEPDPRPPDAPAEPGAPLWGRTFVSVEVTEAGRPRPLIDGTRLEVTFERRDDGEDAVRWRAGCNAMGAPVRVSADRLDVGTIHTTDMGCDPARHAQDDWTASFFETGPFWSSTDGGLRLEAGDTVIDLVPAS